MSEYNELLFNSNGEKYVEILLLEEKVKRAKISYQKRKVVDGWQLTFPKGRNRKEGCILSVSQHKWTDGGKDGFLELFEIEGNERVVHSHKTVGEAFKLIKKRFKEKK